MLRAEICFKCILFWSFCYFRQIIKKERKKKERKRWRKKNKEKKMSKKRRYSDLERLTESKIVDWSSCIICHISIRMSHWNVPLILNVKVMMRLKQIKTLITISIISENSMQYLLTRWFFQKKNAHQICFLLWKQNSISCVETNLVTWITEDGTEN